MKKIHIVIMILTACILASAQTTTKTIGNVSAGGLDYSPFYSGYDYNYEAQLYLSSEIGTSSGTITGLNWYAANANTMSGNVKIYLKEITNTTIPSENWTTIKSGATNVYYGKVNSSGSSVWCGISGISFSYTGTKNLLVLTEMTPQYCSWGNNYRWNTATGRSAKITNNGSAPTGTFNASDNRPCIQIISSTPLPVELNSFTALSEQNDVTLNWKTATETNNYGFEIERTTTIGHPEQAKAPIYDPVGKGDWIKIGFVEGNGTTNAPKSYTFTDKSANGKISYRLKQIDRDGKFEYSQTVEVTALSAPKEFALAQNYPNPFNPTTVISFQLSVNGFTTLKIYDAIGREVATLVNEVKDAGTYSAKFDGAKLSSGVYFAKLTSSAKTQMKKLLLLK